MILVSSCLAGINCRYDGKNNKCEKVIELLDDNKAIPICPEQIGGLQTPRDPAEIIENKVITINGEDITEKFKFGVEQILKVVDFAHVNKAILKSKSPSCGCGKIYDGTFSGTLIDGDGLLTKALKEKGITVVDENNIDSIL